jgi:hypothetical protein
VRQLKTFSCGLEVTLWALWFGALWALALWIAPSLFKWLPRPEAGLVAGRLFYMMSWGSGLLALVLLCLAVLNQGVLLGATSNFFGLRWPVLFIPALLMLVVLLVVAVEIWGIHPHMRDLRQAMAQAAPELVPMLKAEFGRMHAYSTTVYAIKMMAVLVWGLLRYTPRQSA